MICLRYKTYFNMIRHVRYPPPPTFSGYFCHPLVWKCSSPAVQLSSWDFPSAAVITRLTCVPAPLPGIPTSPLAFWWKVNGRSFLIILVSAMWLKMSYSALLFNFSSSVLTKVKYSALGMFKGLLSCLQTCSIAVWLFLLVFLCPIPPPPLWEYVWASFFSPTVLNFLLKYFDIDLLFNV